MSCLQKSMFLATLLGGLAIQAQPAWPKLEVVDEVDIPGNVIADSRPIQLHVQRVRGEISELLPLFRAAFLHSGFYVPPARQLTSPAPHLLSVTGFDVEDRKSYSVILEVAGDHLVTVIYGQVNLAPEARVAGLGDPLPAYPGAAAPARVSSEGGTVSVYDVKAQKTAVRAFYQGMLAEHGYKALKPEDEDTLIFEGHGEALRISLLETPAKKVRVLLTSHLTSASSGL